LFVVPSLYVLLAKDHRAEVKDAAEVGDDTLPIAAAAE
jgi:hypothetical protein